MSSRKLSFGGLQIMDRTYASHWQLKSGRSMDLCNFSAIVYWCVLCETYNRDAGNETANSISVGS